MFCVKLFEEHRDIKEIYHNNFKYILVDEFRTQILFKTNG